MFVATKSHINFVLLTGLLIRLVIALINSYIGPTLGGEVDAVGFSRMASDFAITQNSETDDLSRVGLIYVQVLGYFYHYFFDSIFFGCLLSITAWFFSAIAVLKLLDILKCESNAKFFAILFFVLTPSSIFYTSVTLREPFQLLFLTMLVYSMVRFYINNSALHFFLVPLWALGLGSLHNALTVITMICIFAYIVFFSLVSLNNILNKVRFYLIILICLILIPVSFLIFDQFSAYTHLTEEGFLYAVQAYQEGLLGDGAGARSFYRTEAIGDDIGTFLLFLPIAFVQYQLEPLPWNIGSIADLFLFTENIIRSSLIILSGVYLYKNKNKMFKKVYFSFLFIFIIYFAVEILWSLGTINWGTASRHHIPSIGLLVLVAAPALGNLRFLYSNSDQNKSAQSF